MASAFEKNTGLDVFYTGESDYLVFHYPPVLTPPALFFPVINYL
jgi:hypothetical protein